MKKKTPTPKKRRTSKPAQVISTNNLIDHHALALLEYIDSGGRSGIDAVRQAREILDGVALALTKGTDDGQDPDIMHGSKFGPGVFSMVFGEQVKAYQQRGDDFPDFKNELQFMAELDGDKTADLTITDPEVAYDVLVGCICNAAVLGAALAIELMRERAR